MSSGFIVTGTDTGIGKTVFSAALVGALDGYYWKPVQSGLSDLTEFDQGQHPSPHLSPTGRGSPDAPVATAFPLPEGEGQGEGIYASEYGTPYSDFETDSETVRRLSGLPANRILPEAYRLTLPASPHVSAAREGVKIEPDQLKLPECDGPLVVEGAGGLLVPLSPDLLEIDQFASWGMPVILCARTALGTINHTLLSLEAMARRSMRVHGVAFIGDAAEETESTIISFGGARRLGRLPFINPLNAERLAAAFGANFDISDFLAEPPA